MRSPRSVVLLALGAMSLLTSCAARLARFDEAGLAAHRAAAERERALVAVHRAQFDPYATVTYTSNEPLPAGTPLMSDPLGTNPTAWHLDEAARHEAHARAHATIAAGLQAFEASACASIPPVERGACPILPGALGVEEIDGGVRIRFRTGAEAARLAIRMRCHLAYARVVGGARAPACPLYVRGVDVALTPDARGIEVVGARPGIVAEIRKRIAELVH